MRDPVQVILQDVLHATERSDGPLYKRAQAIIDELAKRGLEIQAKKPERETRSQQFYRGIELGQTIEYARDQVRRGYVIDDEHVKLLRRYDPDALADTPYDKKD